MGQGSTDSAHLCCPGTQRGVQLALPPGLWAGTRPAGIKGVKASALNRGFNDRSWGGWPGCPPGTPHVKWTLPARQPCPERGDRSAGPWAGLGWVSAAQHPMPKSTLPAGPAHRRDPPRSRSGQARERRPASCPGLAPPLSSCPGLQPSSPPLLPLRGQLLTSQSPDCQHFRRLLRSQDPPETKFLCHARNCPPTLYSPRPSRFREHQGKAGPPGCRSPSGPLCPVSRLWRKALGSEALPEFQRVDSRGD